MSAPVHLSQLPAEVRQVLDEHRAAWEAEDRRLESALLRAAREARLAERVPVLCQALISAGQGHRQTYLAVALALGFHPNWVRRLYERSRHAQDPR